MKKVFRIETNGSGNGSLNTAQDPLPVSIFYGFTVNSDASSLSIAAYNGTTLVDISGVGVGQEYFIRFTEHDPYGVALDTTTAPFVDGGLSLTVTGADPDSIFTVNLYLIEL